MMILYVIGRKWWFDSVVYGYVKGSNKESKVVIERHCIRSHSVEDLLRAQL